MKYYGTIGTSQQTVVKDTIQYSPMENEILMNEARPSAEHIAKEDGTWYIPQPDLEELKAAKLAELKLQRDTAEVLPIEYNGSSYDYDEKARDRINAAIIALELQGEEATIEWTLADNGTATVTANDLKAVIAAVAVRSNTLHIAYRNAKEKVEEAQSKEELDAIVLGE